MSEVRGYRSDYAVYAAVSFFGSFLLMVVQPIAGKVLLPRFGGGSSVWTTLMLFFLGMLFAGYLYGFWIKRFSPKRQAVIHGALLSLSIVFLAVNYFLRNALLPVEVGIEATSPVLDLLSFVCAGVGVPYFLLATTSTLLQEWYAQKHPERPPFSLYQVSNIGAFVGLLGYPFVMEPFFSLRAQSTAWIIIFAVYAAGMARIAYLKWQKASDQQIPAKGTMGRKFSMRDFYVWMSLSFVANAALLAITAHMTQSMLAIPLIWLIPLALFFLTFVIAFGGEGWYSRKFHGALMLFSIIVCALFVSGAVGASLPIAFGAIIFASFAIPLVCHAELFRRRPIEGAVAQYYVSIALGGFLAALFCSVAAPFFFPNTWEFPISLILAGCIAVAVLWASSDSKMLRIQFAVFGAGVLMVTAYFFSDVWGSGLLKGFSVLEKTRNFYGTIRITRGALAGYPIRTGIVNGAVDHGFQFQSEEIRNEPTLYYARDTGVGQILQNHPNRAVKKPLRIGVIGLGAGTLAAYCEKGDYIRFYEIDPDVIRLSSQYFSFIPSCKEKGGFVDIVAGDARIRMQEEMTAGRREEFDVLAVDAYAGGSVPAHLYTKQALDLYISQLKQGGIIAFHTTNEHIDLARPLLALARAMDLYAYVAVTNSTSWVLLSQKQIEKPFLFAPAKSLPDPETAYWTDDFSSVARILK